MESKFGAVILSFCHVLCDLDLTSVSSGLVNPVPILGR